LKRLNLRWAT